MQGSSPKSPESLVDLSTLSPAAVPARLALLHAELGAGAGAELVLAGGLSEQFVRDLCAGGGFELIRLSRRPGAGEVQRGRVGAGKGPGPGASAGAGGGPGAGEGPGPGGAWRVTCTQQRTLPDFVGPDMRVLVCGLNPSLVAADAGFGFATPSNRFWRAAADAGLITVPRAPLESLRVDGVGMTDMVKRATARSHHLDRAEYVAGAERVRRLVSWLSPAVVVFVGLEGWRAAVDRRAVVGWQPEAFAGAPAYVMPSTSGANAHARLVDLTAHLAGVVAGAAG